MLLAVDLDRDEPFVQHTSDLGIAEALACHHVAPVARGVSDRHEHRHVALTRCGERRLTPRIPVDGIGGVCPQVGARGIHETIAHQPSLGPNRALGRSGPHRAADRSDSAVKPKRAAQPWAALFEWMSGGVLLSHRVAPAVPSALRVLASGFGMCPGVSLALWPPKLVPHRARHRGVGWVCGLGDRTRVRGGVPVVGTCPCTGCGCVC